MAGIAQFRDTEIEQLHAASRQHDVLRLAVMMDNALLMPVLDRIGTVNRVLPALSLAIGSATKCMAGLSRHGLPCCSQRSSDSTSARKFRSSPQARSRNAGRS